MTETDALIDGLKRALRARGLTYAHVGKKLRLSEASIKRLFSKGGFSMERFEQACALAGTSVLELAKDAAKESEAVSQLTLDQERAIMRDRKLLLVAVCALNHLDLNDITALYQLSKAEGIRLLLELQRIRFLELLPENKIRLRVTHTFTWLPNGPIQQYFKAKAQNEYFAGHFDKPTETMLLVNAMLTPSSIAMMNAKLRRLANEMAEMHEEHKRLRLGERRSVTLLLALRPWELQDFMDLRRERRTAPVVNVMTSENAVVADQAESAAAMIMAAPGGQDVS